MSTNMVDNVYNIQYDENLSNKEKSDLCVKEYKDIIGRFSKTPIHTYTKGKFKVLRFMAIVGQCGFNFNTFWEKDGSKRPMKKGDKQHLQLGLISSDLYKTASKEYIKYDPDVYFTGNGKDAYNLLMSRRIAEGLSGGYYDLETINKEYDKVQFAKTTTLGSKIENKLVTAGGKIPFITFIDHLARDPHLESIIFTKRFEMRASELRSTNLDIYYSDDKKLSRECWGNYMSINRFKDYNRLDEVIRGGIANYEDSDIERVDYGQTMLSEGDLIMVDMIPELPRISRVMSMTLVVKAPYVAYPYEDSDRQKPELKEVITAAHDFEGAGF